MAFKDLNFGIRVNGAFPLDAKSVVADEAARFALTGTYEGLHVFQEDNSQTYVCISAINSDSEGGWNTVTSNGVEDVRYSNGELTVELEDGTEHTFEIPGLRANNPLTNNGDGTYTFHFIDSTQDFTTEDFQAKDIESATGVTSGDDVVVTFVRKDTTTFESTFTDLRGPQGLRGFQGAYPILVYRVGTIASDFTGDLTSTFDTDAVFGQDNGTPTDWLANRSGVLADGEIYWVRQAIVDPSLVTEGSTTLTLTWGTPFQEESGAGGATAGVIEYTNGAGGTLEVAQWIGTIGQYNALTDGIKNSEILFTITNDQTEVAEAGSGAYGDSDVQAYLNTNTYVGGLTATAAEINLLDGKVDADLMNTQLSETDIANFGFTKDTNTNLSKTDITNFGFVADATTIAGYGITDALDGALLQPDLGVSGAATLVTTTSDASEIHTQGTLPVANLVQQEGAMLGVGRAAAAGNIELQNTSGNSQIRIYSPDNGTSVIQFRNTSTLETSIRQNNDTGVFDILTGGGSAISITGTGITFDRPVSGGGIPTFSVGTAFPTVGLADGQEFYLEADVIETERVAIEVSGTPVTYTQDNYQADNEFGAGTATDGLTGPISRVTWSAARNTWTNWTAPAGFVGDNDADTGTPLGIFLTDGTELIFGAGAGVNGDNLDWLRGDFQGDTNVAVFTDNNVTTPAGLYKYINATIGWIQITTT